MTDVSQPKIKKNNLSHSIKNRQKIPFRKFPLTARHLRVPRASAEPNFRFDVSLIKQEENQ
jgi:hypothetical protein